MLAQRFVQMGGAVPKEPALCLVTGVLLRAGKRPASELGAASVSPHGECTHHVRTHLSGVGVFLLTRKARPPGPLPPLSV